MKPSQLRKRRLGIDILVAFYLALIVLYILSLSLFSTRVVVFGKTVTSGIAIFIHLFFLTVYLFLSIGIKNFWGNAFRTAIFLHIFFIFNGLLMFFNMTALLEVEGAHLVSYPFKTQVVATSIVINILIVFFLISKKALFFVDKV